MLETIGSLDGRVAQIDRPSFQNLIGTSHGVRSKYGRSADRRSAENDGARRQPRSGLYNHRLRDECHISSVRMASRCDEGLLGHHGIVTEDDLVLVVYPDALANPGPVTDLQLPREFDSRPRPEDDVATDVGAKQAKHSDPELRTYLPCIRYEQQFRDSPQIDHRLWSTPTTALTRCSRKIYDPIFFAHVSPDRHCALCHSITRPLPDAIVALVTPPKLRVTILALNYVPEPTGNAPYTASLAEGLAAAGHSVRIITGYPHYPEWRLREGYDGWSRNEIINGITVKRLRHYVPRRPDAVRRMHMELSFGVRAMLTGWGRPHVVLVVSPALFSSGLAMLRARVQLNRPAIGVWVQDIYSRGLIETGTGSGRAAGVVARIESMILRSADGVVAIHERFREHIVGSLGVRMGAVAVIRNWTHLPESPTVGREDFRQQFGWGTEDVVVLHAGNMGKKQGLENVINAARIAQARQSPVRFVLMGDGNQRQRLESLAVGVGNLDFVDPLPGSEFQLALAAADVLLVNELPGVKDMAVPSKLTSYFNAGVPVLAATDDGSVTAFEITASGGGVRVNAADPAALVDAAEDLGRNPFAASELGARGLRFSRDTLSESAAVHHYDEFITSLASSRGR